MLLLFCRSCGKELVVTPAKTCANCGAHPVKASAFCRYCGHTTSIQDVVCPTCGAAIKPIPSRVKVLFNGNPKLIKLGKILNLTIVLIIVSLYVWFAIPREVVREPLKAAASDVVMATTGYTALPLSFISAYPKRIPMLMDGGQDLYSPVTIFTVNTTQQLTIYAYYRNTTDIFTGSGSGRFEEVTDKAVYQSSNDKVATVTAGGLVQGVTPGSVLITVSYTAAPGSANRSAAAEGKVPITVTCTVPVTVAPVPVTERTAPAAAR